MIRAHLVLLLLIGLALRCGHARRVENQEPERTAKQSSEHKSKPTSDEAGRERGVKREGGRGEGSPGNGEAPPLAMSPAGLLQPGAIAALQDKLIERGYLDKSARSQQLDDKTTKALRDFQRDEGLPATGTPDDLTVKKLGLSPGDVFRASPGSGKS